MMLRPPSADADSQPQSALSESTYHSASSEFPTSVATTPDQGIPDDVFGIGSVGVKVDATPDERPQTPNQTPSRSSFSRSGSNANPKVPPAYPTRTPARTKRRSVSSTLSDPSTPTFEKTNGVLPVQDFSSLLQTPAPIIFSTPLERELLNSLSMLGFDTGQIVHSVLSDACDATGALWWMLKRRAEKRALEEVPAGAEGATAKSQAEDKGKHRARDKDSKKIPAFVHAAVDASQSMLLPAMTQAHSAPELQLIPPTPTASVTTRPRTPPRTKSPTSQLLSPTPSTADISIRSHPSTPGGSMKDKDGSKGRKARSGSVSIMQRATTALEAAGLVRKKSAEGVREEKEKERATDKRTGNGSGDEPRVSHGSGSSKLAKSPPLKSNEIAVPTTPPSSAELNHVTMSSPWVLTNSRASPPPTDSPRDTLSALPNITGNKGLGNRNRASLLSAFRMWFKEDPKGKRKEHSPTHAHLYTAALNNPGPSSVSGRSRPTVKRRASGNRAGRQARSKRTSVSSRRSSSVNSRRSSVHSTHFPLLESPGLASTSVSRRRSDASRRSFGSHTPNSEREDLVSRPSSMQSFYGQQRHRKSPSASSAGSMHPGRTSSPLPSKYHRRAGSGSSTRVMRQMQPPNLAHLRSNSASSAQSRGSSHPGSSYDLSESDSRRNSSPHKPQVRRSLEETPRRAHTPTAFAAHKRQTPFANPSGSGGYLNSLGRSSWKKSWGLEPPGWQTRQAYSAIEVLAISPPVDGQGIRDVFSGRQSLSMGDESDWVDEDDDSPGYAGGLGQMPMAACGTAGPSYSHPPETPILSPAPRGNASRASSSKRTPASLAPVNVSSRGSRGKAGRSPVGRSSPLPSESSFEPPEPRGGRRQLPAGRSGPAAIQEEDEDEE